MPLAPDHLAPGIYALHRADWTQIQPRTLTSDALEYSMSVEPAPTKTPQATGSVVIVLAGEIELAGLGMLKSGDAFVTAPGLQLVSASTGAGWLVISCAGLSGPDAALAIRPVDHDRLPGCDPTPPEVLLSETPVQHDLTLYKDTARNFGAGLWDSTPYHRRSIPFPKFEVMHMVSGSIELTQDNGGTSRFEKGDTFLIAKGTQCDWKTEGMKKIFCSFVPER